MAAQQDDRPYLEGMRLAAEEVNAAGGIGGHPLTLALHDDGGEPERATEVMGGLLRGSPKAILFVGPGPALSPLRSQFGQSGTPVILLGGDLYTSRGLFPQVFQTTLPWEWQAHVLARYLVVDRHAKHIVFAGAGPEASSAAAAAKAQLEYWGGALSGAVTIPAGRDPAHMVGQVRGADAVIDFGSASDSLRMAAAIQQASHAPPRIAASSSLLASQSGSPKLPPGTVACYTYTWAGWAEPIPRVAGFRQALAGATRGQEPAGLEQEGYDAVRTLAYFLRRNEGMGGAALGHVLEGARNLQFSSFPIDLGPDDHEFLPRDELGLFAIAGPDERLDPWEGGTSEPWRPLMRTFTYDGLRDDILDRDKRIFFPFWGKDKPGPFYWQSRYGIVTRPAKDPLH
jgi:ABC-type branched-subunit amino acid transport system substrate-binding protein